MKSVSVLISFALTTCYSMSLSEKKTGSNNLYEPKNQGNLKAADEFILSLLPLKILLEYQLRTPEELEEVPVQEDKKKLQEHYNAGNLKLFSNTSKKDIKANGFCNEIILMKNLTLSEISSILINDKNPNEKPLSNEQLEKVYNSLKDCFFVKARNAKLWGPLWHCLNRLFLFFVFN